jgi:hypothetical protein
VAATPFFPASRLANGSFNSLYPKRNSLAMALKRGEGILVIELNDPTSEATHIYHPHTHLHTTFLTLILQWRQAIEIGNHNADHGAHVSKSS